MAVYTTLTELEIRSLLARFHLPELERFQGADSGVENTTYFLTLRSGIQYVLTIFENLSAQSLSAYIQLTTRLHEHDLPVPCPLIDKHGTALQTIADKPALLFIRAPGNHVELAEPSICHQVGSMLAKIHSVTITPNLDSLSLPHSMDSSSMGELLTLVTESLHTADIVVLKDQRRLLESLGERNLSRGVIHGDLFRDNVLVLNNTITAVIDFYSASRSILLLDLAIVANDWCFMQNDIDTNHQVTALLDGYQTIRPFGAEEVTSWQDSLQVAAAWLWLSRQKRQLFSRQGEKVPTKNPDEYRSLLFQHLKTAKKST